jgi:hypothetical protein
MVVCHIAVLTRAPFLSRKVNQVSGSGFRTNQELEYGMLEYWHGMTFTYHSIVPIFHFSIRLTPETFDRSLITANRSIPLT